VAFKNKLMKYIETDSVEGKLMYSFLKVVSRLKKLYKSYTTV